MLPNRRPENGTAQRAHRDGAPRRVAGEIAQEEKRCSFNDLGISRQKLAATVYELEKLRCNLCGEVYTAAAPLEAGDKKYDATAVSMMAVLR